MANKLLKKDEIKNTCNGIMQSCSDKTYVICKIFQICFDKKYIDNSEVNVSLYNKNESFFDLNNLRKEYKNVANILNNLTYDELKDLTKYLVIDYRDNSYFKNSPITQSHELNNLIFDLLSLNKEGDKVFDFGFSEGNFLLSTLDRAEKEGINIASISGCEIIHRFCMMTNMVFAILNYKNTNINLIDCDGVQGKDFVFNKGFVFPPFGLRYYEDYKIQLDDNIIFNTRISSEWLFIDKMINASKEFDKIVAILLPRCLYNIADENYKKSLIKKGLIEGIIELPNNLFDGTTLKAYVVIFSRNNKEVKFVNASNMIKLQTKKGSSIILDNNRIFESYNSNDVEKVSNETLLKRDELNLTHISEMNLNFKNSVALSSVAEVFTGSQYTLKNFEKYLCDDEKKCTYKLIASNDIDEYSVKWDTLNMINTDDQKLEKFAVQKNDVIITSKSSKVKIAVVDFNPKIKCIVTGGMIIVRPDTSKLNPYYLKVFLESNIGVEILKSIQKGGSYIVTISANNLANIKINLLDINKQNEIADIYTDKLSSLLAYKQLIDDIETSLSNLYQDECED